MLATGGVLVVGILLGVWSWNRKNDASQAVAPPSATVAARVPTGRDAADGSSPVYDDLLREHNAKAAAAAAQTGDSSNPQSAMPTIRPQVEASPFGVNLNKPGAPTTPSPKTAPTPPPAAAPTADPNYTKAMTEREQAIKQRATDMQAQADLLRKAWAVAGHTQMVAPEEAAAASGTTPAPAHPGNAAPPAASMPAAALAHAGDTVVAVLDSPIDTDNPLPMYRATIVQDGPLHGATLLGTVQVNTANRWNTGVPLTFNQISLPGQPMQAVSAFAINANDAGSLKGQVDKHLWARYGAAFGGAFLQGVGQGLLAGGREQQVITSPTGYAVQSNAYTNKQLLELGAANVGQVAATSMQAEINRPNTIRIPGGTTIAVFFSADFPTSK